ncbi:hypothetical protein J6500_11440 [Bradyrhizobium sp. WSM 1704]|uniref:hypothetical protein n=1 Tax=Bradyrhizobium semiaridum TaxID=2821404 RepID=UPI001CE2BC76|nr:hypothetical protein [Bradyrhizobium semiaridum]MCA6122499.1 hypothetical protein [Bradyrhizobium semiaridum]
MSAATCGGGPFPDFAALIRATLAIDQYAEAALGNREFFLNKPYSVGPIRKVMSRSNGASPSCMQGMVG